MKICALVTGGAGLIGSQIVEDLIQQGAHDVFVTDHLGTSAKWTNLSRNPISDYWEKDDFLNLIKESPKKLPEFTHIFHLGACSSTTEPDATYLMRNNFGYTKDLSHFALKRDLPFLYASSAATYGDGEEGYSESIPLKKLRPLNAYGYSKQLFDLYAEKKGILKKITGLKYFNVFGFGEAHKGSMRSLVLKGYEQILETGKLRLFRSYRSDIADGEQRRDFLYVKDASLISIYLLLEGKTGIYNVGRGVAETWNSLADALFQALQKERNVEYIDMPEELREKYQYYTCADTTKLKESGYSKEFTSLENAVKDYIQLLENSGKNK